MLKKQRGFALMAYAALAAGVVILALGVALKVQSSRLASVKQEYAGFVATTKALGDAAQKESNRVIAANKLNKEKADAENKRISTELVAVARQLRDARARSSFVPAPAAGSGRPAVAAFDRAQLESALRQLDDGVSDLVGEGDQARVDLDTAKSWAAPLKP